MKVRVQQEKEVRQSVEDKADDTQDTLTGAIEYRRTKRANSRRNLDLWDELEKE